MRVVVSGIVLVALTSLLSACGGGSTTSGTASTGSSSHKNTAGCLVGASNCASGSDACNAAEQTIQLALAKTAKPTVEIVSGPSVVTTKKAIRNDREIIRQVIDQVSALRSTYLTCPNADPNLDANIAALKSYLH